MKWNRIARPKKVSIEKHNYTPPKLRGDGAVECAICGIRVEYSQMVKSPKGNMVCKRCDDN